MKLPDMEYTENIKRTVQDKFGGYNHSPAAVDSQLFDMTNMSGHLFPALATRPPRHLFATLATPHGIGAKDKLFWVDGTGFYYDGVNQGAVADSDKTFAVIGPHIVILPDKKYYNTVTDTFGDLEATWSGASLTFQDGLLYGEAATANTVYAAGVTWSTYFTAGDAVTISGCTTHPENNKTPVIREIDGDKMYFYENIFTNGAETGTMTIKRSVPDLDFVCENANRLWGCKGDTIYCSKPGDPKNWNVFDGLATDSYAVPVGSAGDFTAGVSAFGYPIMFKDQHIHKMYGSLPSNFDPVGSANLGVMAGSGKSPAIAGEILFYLSRVGIVAYSGGIPAPIEGVFGEVRYKNGVAGSDGLRYYISMQDDAGAWHLFTYNAETRLWHREDSTHAIGFAMLDNLYMLGSDGKLWIVGKTISLPEGATEESAFAWSVETADYTNKSVNKKGVSRIQIRLALDADSTFKAEIQYDSSGTWTTVKELTAETAKATMAIGITPRRCDHYRLRLSGTGACRIYAIGQEFYSGSDI